MQCIVSSVSVASRHMVCIAGADLPRVETAPATMTQSASGGGQHFDLAQQMAAVRVAK